MHADLNTSFKRPRGEYPTSKQVKVDQASGKADEASPTGTYRCTLPERTKSWCRKAYSQAWRVKINKSTTQIPRTVYPMHTHCGKAWRLRDKSRAYIYTHTQQTQVKKTPPVIAGDMHIGAVTMPKSANLFNSPASSIILRCAFG